MNHPDEPALVILSNILSNGRGTRLDDALYYDRSITSAVGAYQSSDEIAGQFIIAASSEARPLRRLLKPLDKQIARFLANPPTEAELDRARKAVRASLLRGIEGLEGRAEAMVDCHRLTGEVNCLGPEYALYQQVTVDDVMRVARATLVADRRVTLSVVPTGDAGHLPGAEPVEIQ